MINLISEYTTKYFSLYPPLIFIRIIDNIHFGNYTVAFEECAILLIEFCLIFIIYLFTLRSISKNITNDNRLLNLSRSLLHKFSFNKQPMLKLLSFTRQEEAFIIKDIFYIIRNHRIKTWFLLILISVYLISNLQIDNLLKHIITISITFIILLPLACNYFAFDNKGLLLYFITPISLKNVLTNKNKSIVIICLLISIPIIIWDLVINSFSLYFVLITIPILVYQLYCIIIIGSAISLYFPYKVDYEKIMGQFNPVLSQPYIFVSFMLSQGILALFIYIFSQNKLILLLSIFSLSFISFIIYSLLLKHYFINIFLRRKTIIIKEITKNEIILYE